MTMTTPSSSSSSSSSTASCTIVYSTQTGRARACARRTARILREKTQLTLLGGTPFDELVPSFLDYQQHQHGQQQQQQNHFFLLFVSTTGDGVHCDSITQTWKSLLKKSLSSNKLQGVQFALFCLGDRAYGPQFCAAGRKLAVRLMQLGATSCCEVGYGDDNTPNGGCFADLDRWIQQQLLLSSSILLEQPNTSTVTVMTNNNTTDTTTTRVDTSHYKVTVLQEQTKDAMDQWQQDWCQESYQAFFAHQSPMTAYRYDSQANNNNNTPPQQNKPLIAQVESNTRLTAPDWDQNTRHIRLQLTGYNTCNNKQTTPTERQLPYQAGDIATIMPCNPLTEVERFIQTLPTALQTIADKVLHLDYYQQQQQQQQANLLGDAFPHWPAHCTLRGWLTYCADIHAPPEREDLRAISQFCSIDHGMGAAQRDKLLSLSETAASALYVDYILREKRCWTDVLYDFDSLRHLGSGLTVEALLAIVPPMRPRDFSIASAPTTSTKPDGDFVVELCVAVVEGTTPLGRSYHGLCSHYLSTLLLQDSTTVLQMWIRPGSFHGLPLTPSQNDTTSEKRRWFENPVLCIGAGTGVAPLRGLILEREAVRAAQQKSDEADSSTIAPFAATTNGDSTSEKTLDQYDNLLIFGCRKRDADYYYQNEWTQLQNRMVVIPAFSREQARKVYVQQLIKQNGEAIVRHIMENDGAIYIAGGPSMARYSKEELIDATARVLLDGDEKKANLLFKKMQARGRFRVEAWS